MFLYSTLQRKVTQILKFNPKQNSALKIFFCFFNLTLQNKKNICYINKINIWFTEKNKLQSNKTEVDDPLEIKKTGNKLIGIVHFLIK